MVKKKSKQQIIDEGNFYVDIVPRRLIPFSLVAAAGALISAILYDLLPGPQGWYVIFQYVINLALAPPLLALYLIVLGLFLAGKHTASFMVIISGIIINYVTIILGFAWLYMAISKANLESFSDPIRWIDGLSMSVGIATTIGFSIRPLSIWAQSAVIFQEILSFIITVILIAWVMSGVTSAAQYRK